MQSIQVSGGFPRPSILVSMPMPRFRRKKPDITVTEVVRKVLQRAAGNQKQFAVFFFNDPCNGRRVVLCDMCTDRFKAFERKYPKALVGTYDKHVSVIALMDDLQEFFVIEGCE